MFRKYYKEANDDIKPGEALINAVILNAKEKRTPKRLYLRYAVSAAAAVFLISAAVISMPYLKQNDSDDGVVIENAVSDQTPTPQTAPSASVPTDNYQDSQSGKKDIANTSLPSYNDYNDSKKEASGMPNLPAERGEEQEADIAEINGKAEEAEQEQDEGVNVAESAEKFSVQAGMNYNSEPTSGVDTDEANEVFGLAASGAAADAYTKSLSMVNLSAPSGFYVTMSTGSEWEFSDGSGAQIHVSASKTDEGDMAAVYTEYGAELVKDGIRYIISSDGAERSAVEELVNSI